MAVVMIVGSGGGGWVMWYQELAVVFRESRRSGVTLRCGSQPGWAFVVVVAVVVVRLYSGRS